MKQPSKCLACGKETVTQSHQSRAKKFCNNKCQHQFNRDNDGYRKPPVTKEQLVQWYEVEKKSLGEIGQLIGKSGTAVCRYFKKFGIKSRPFSTKGLPGSQLGVKMSDETKAKLSVAHMGKELSQEHREKVMKTLKYGLKKESNHTWKGGVFVSKKGYKYLRKPDHPHVLSNGYVAEHRYIMEQKIGRLLGKFEHVHHINGIKSDNRIENLELLNGHTHNLVTRMEERIRELEEEITRLRSV